MPKLDEDASDVSGVGAILATEIKSGMVTSRIHFFYQDHACVIQIYESASFIGIQLHKSHIPFSPARNEVTCSLTKNSLLLKIGCIVSEV